MRFALLTTAAALLAGASAQSAAAPASPAAMMEAGIAKLAGMAHDAAEAVRSLDRPNMADTGTLVVAMLTNIAGEMETQAAGLSPAAVQDTSSSEAAMTPFSDEEQQRVCNAFGHMAGEGYDLLSELIKIRSLLEGTQFMEPVGVMMARWPAPFEVLFAAFMQHASNCAQDTVQSSPDVASRLGEAIGAYTSN